MLVSQFGIPGAVELLVVVLVLFLFGAPLVLLALFLVNRRQDQRDRVEELEAQVDELQTQVGELQAELDAERSRD